jgi:hypothetical protein
MSQIPAASSNKPPEPAVPVKSDFSQQANEVQPSLLAEFLDFLVHNKAWWLTPIIIVLLLVGVLVVVGSSVAAPFIYTIF